MDSSPLDSSVSEMAKALGMSFAFKQPNPLWASTATPIPDSVVPDSNGHPQASLASTSSQTLDKLSRVQEPPAPKREVKQLCLRPYQEELAKAALLGKNAIIVAPTGSGKTWVAVKIIKEHLESSPNGSKNKKVAFIVPTVPLVTQQSSVFMSYLEDHIKVCAISGGETDTPKGTNIFNSHVTVATPQCLVNMIHNPSPEDKINIWDFSLIVFDECHHCDQKHPYMELMNVYLDLKLKTPSEIPEGACLPQIVGLTASLGVGGGEQLEHAVQHIIRMGAHLDAHYISTVDKFKDDLDKYVNVPRDELVTVEFDQPGHPFAIHLFDQMDWLERSIFGCIGKKFAIIIDSLLKKKSPIMDGLKARPYDRNGKLGRVRYEEAYAGWIGTLLSRAAQVNDKTEGRKLMSCLQNLKIYQQALDLHAHLPLKQAVNWLRCRMAEFETRFPMMNDDEREIYDGWKSLESCLVELEIQDNRLVRKLVDIIRRQFADQEDSRVIIFVKTRDLTRGIQEMLENEPDLCKYNPDVLTSVNVQQEKGGQSMGTQEAVLSDFRAGRCRILAATTVAEEGLDIEKCNLIIKYNSVSSEIAMVQKRGRGRALGSKSIMLTAKGVVADKEMMNMLKEKLMVKALESIKEDGHRAFRARVEKVEKFEFTDRRLDEKMLQDRIKSLGNKVFTLHCKHCSEFICQSTQVRKVQSAHFVVVDPKIWERVHVGIHRKPKVLYQLAMAGQLSCRNCPTSQELGNVIKYQNTILPTLKAHSIKIVDVEDTAKTKIERQWKGIEESYFVVPPIQMKDKELMYHTLQEKSRQLMEEEIVRTQKRQLEMANIGVDED